MKFRGFGVSGFGVKGLGLSGFRPGGLKRKEAWQCSALTVMTGIGLLCCRV